ncbi:MAG: ADP-ribosylglycohydrolase family protein [Myxococcota bacterium]
MKALDRALLALEGLSIGDALGDQFNAKTVAIGRCLLQRDAPPGPWRWTDDTLMACSVVEVLEAHGTLDPLLFADSLVARYEPGRGYGPAMRRVLKDADSGAAAMHQCSQLFEGTGSYGNGAVMRIAPLGAYLLDPALAAREAERSACATHAHPEAAAGAAAIAAAAALLLADDVDSIFASLLDLVPPSEVRNAIENVRRIPFDTAPLEVAKRTRAIRDISCQRTAPFCLWVALRNKDNFERAIWDVTAVGGDRDTHAAIVGGMLACRVGADAIPTTWRERREPLPSWITRLSH